MKLINKNKTHKITKDTFYVITERGSTEYFKIFGGISILHREDGPAGIYPDGVKIWCVNGLYHREDGPAVEGDGCFYYLYDKIVSDKDFFYLTQYIEKYKYGI